MLKSIPLANITALPNYRTIDTDNGEFADLVASIKQDEVLQSVLVRPNYDRPNHYELIAGNRRFLASIKAGKKDIPAKIKDIKDDDVIVYQTKENLQRKDVHPMDEAAGFKAYQAKKKCDVKELAAVFAKSERYIINRLALNNLTADLQKDFLKELLNVAQAEIFAKLPAAEQKELKNNAFDNYNKTYESAKELKETIEQDFLLKLDAAPWKLDDKKIIASAGSCNDCKKRSGCQALLFADIVKDDRCMDKVCYNAKKEAFFKDAIEKVVIENTEIKFLKKGDIGKDVLDLSKKYNVPVLDGYSWQVSDSKQSGYLPVKCFVVSGSDKGKFKTVYVTPDSSTAAKAAKGGTGAAAINDQTAAIQQRLDRGKELDYEKEQEVVSSELKKLLSDKDFNYPIEGDVFITMVMFLVYKNIDHYNTKFAVVDCGLKDDDTDPQEFFNKLQKLNGLQKSKMLMLALYKQYGSHRQKTRMSFIIRRLAEYVGVDVKAIENEQLQIAAKREANAQKKITALQATAAPAKAAKPKADIPASKKAKPVKKKAVKPATKKAAAPVKKKAGKKPIVKTKKKVA